MAQLGPIAHSLIEVHLHAALLPCRACSRRGFLVRAATREPHEDALILHATAACGACGGEVRLSFDSTECRPEDLDPASARRIPIVVNRSGRPSEVIDVVQWLTLYGMAVDSAGFPADRKLIRAALLEAGQCLAEALRFYVPDNDLPPQNAFFAAESLERFREHPNLFTRSRLIELSEGLPVSAVNPPAALAWNRPTSTMWWLP